MNKLKVLKKSDYVALIFGKWFDEVNGNSYYDVEVTVNETTHCIPYQYGYSTGSSQSIAKALTSAGYRVRNSTRDYYAPYRAILTAFLDKRESELFK